MDRDSYLILETLRPFGASSITPSLLSLAIKDSFGIVGICGWKCVVPNVSPLVLLNAKANNLDLSILGRIMISRGIRFDLKRLIMAPINSPSILKKTHRLVFG